MSADKTITSKQEKEKQATCKVCGDPFLTRRKGSGLWMEVCKKPHCLKAGLLKSSAVTYERTARDKYVHPNGIDGGGRTGRFFDKKHLQES